MDRLGRRRVEGSEIHVSVNKMIHKADKIYKNDGLLPNLNALEVSMMLIGYLGLRRIVEIPCRACGLMDRQLVVARPVCIALPSKRALCPSQL